MVAVSPVLPVIASVVVESLPVVGVVVGPLVAVDGSGCVVSLGSSVVPLVVVVSPVSLSGVAVVDPSGLQAARLTPRRTVTISENDGFCRMGVKLRLPRMTRRAGDGRAARV
ncbi:hypothetical protein [Nannocystis pusilla]|uniref:hypothetical protein n=1 Tax=Nannocystis pusilla TaxID=889268 RepID=UPI003B81DD5F